MSPPGTPSAAQAEHDDHRTGAADHLAEQDDQPAEGDDVAATADPR